MHVLLLSQYYPPETGSAAAKIAEMAHFLTGRGHTVSVVSQVPSYPAGVVYPGYEGAVFRREQREGVDIRRTWSYASPQRERFGPRFLNYSTFMATALAGIVSGPRPDLVLVYSPPLFLGLTAALARKIYRCPFIFWVNDLWPRAALFLGFMKSGIPYRLACALEKYIYRQAARIFVYSRRMLAEVVGNGAERGKIECHPLWIDTDVFRPDPAGAGQVRQAYRWGDKFVVLYGGNIGLAQGLDVFINSARLLRDVPDIHLVLVGGGVEKDALQTQVRSLGLTNVEFIDFQPKEKVVSFFSAADVLFAHLKAAPHRVGTVPEKILAYMACGRPVLMAAQDGAALDIVKEYGCGVTAPPDDPEALSQAIRSLYHRRSELDDMGRRGRQAIEAHFAGPQVLAGMEASMQQLVAAHRANPSALP